MVFVGIDFNIDSGDGDVDDNSATWNSVHDSTSGSNADAVGKEMTASEQLVLGFPFPTFSISRMFLPLDLSGEPKGVRLNASIMKLHVKSKINTDNDGDDFIVIVGLTTQNSNTTLITADFDQCGAVDSVTEYSDRVDLSNISISATNQWEINSAGLTKIEEAFQNQGFILFGARTGHDVVDNPPAGNTTTAITVSASEDTTASKRPLLNIQGVYPQGV